MFEFSVLEIEYEYHKYHLYHIYIHLYLSIYYLSTIYLSPFNIFKRTTYGLFRSRAHISLLP